MSTLSEVSAVHDSPNGVSPSFCDLSSASTDHVPEISPHDTGISSSGTSSVITSYISPRGAPSSTCPSSPDTSSGNFAHEITSPRDTSSFVTSSRISSDASHSISPRSTSSPASCNSIGASTTGRNASISATACNPKLSAIEAFAARIAKSKEAALQKEGCTKGKKTNDAWTRKGASPEDVKQMLQERHERKTKPDRLGVVENTPNRTLRDLHLKDPLWREAFCEVQRQLTDSHLIFTVKMEGGVVSCILVLYSKNAQPPKNQPLVVKGKPVEYHPIELY